MRKFLMLSVIAYVFLLIAPFSAFGQGGYFLLKGGMYAPSGDLDDAGFDSGINGEIGLGKYLDPNLSIEFGVGYFESDYSGSFNADFSVLPITLTLKAIAPFQNGEFYLGAGIGVFFAELDLGSGSASDRDDDYVFGGQFVGGIKFNIAQSMFIGLESKYIITNEVQVFDDTVEFDLDGYIVTGVLGFNF